MASNHIDLTPFLTEIYKKVPFKPEIGIVCGSGLSDIATHIQNPITIPYSELGATFPHSAVLGHKNEIVCGTLGSKNVICFRGRFHYYEGWTTQENTLGIRIMGAMGVKLILITNAAGGLPQHYKVGDVMLMNGHINLIGMVGVNPLIGANNDAEGPRFPPITAYDDKLNDHFEARFKAKAAELKHDRDIHRGTYLGLTGPNYETPQEVQMGRIIGAHSVGMSTTNEIVIASHLGIKVVGLSLITNSCVGTEPADKTKPSPNHQEVIDETKKVEKFLQTLVADFIDTVDITALPEAKIAHAFSRENIGKVCPVTGAVGEGECPGLAAKRAQEACGLTTKDTGCPITAVFRGACPVSKASGGSCSFVWGFLGGLVAFGVGVGTLLALDLVEPKKKN